MGVAARLTVAGGGDDGIAIAPDDVARDDAQNIYTQDLNVDGTTTGDPNNVLRPEDDAQYDVSTDFRDARGNRVVEVTTDAAGADTFTLTFRVDPDLDGYYGRAGVVDVDGKFTTGTIEDNDVAATIQAAIRSALPGTDVSVVIGDAPGPFYIIFDREFYSRRYPRVTGTGTGCTVTVTDGGTAAAKGLQEDGGGTGAVVLVPAEVRHLGESKRVSEADSILKPTIGTITVNAGTDEVQTFDYSPGIDGGTISFGFRAGSGDTVTGGLAYNVSYSAFAAAVAALGADAPSVTVRGTSEVQTLELNDIAAADTYKLTADGVETSLITYAADSSAAILAALIAHPSFVAADIVSITATDDDTYPITFTKGFNAPTLTITTFSGFTPTGVTATTAPDWDGFVFTFENGIYAGRPVGLGVLYAHSDLLDDGLVLEPGTQTVTTPGVLGDISAAYTENGAGNSVIAAAIDDVTGESFGYVGDASTPVAIAGIPPGVCHLVLRTVEDGRVSKADSKAFTMTSA